MTNADTSTSAQEPSKIENAHYVVKPLDKTPLATVESIGTSGGIGGVGGIAKLSKTPIKPPLAVLGSIGMAGALQEHGPAHAQA